MGMKTCLTAAGLAMSFMGCAGMEHLMNQGVDNSIEQQSKDNDTDDQRQWKWAMEKKAAAEKRAPVTDKASFTAAVQSVDEYAGNLQTYLDYNCKDTRASKCDEAEKLAPEASKMQFALYAEAMQVPAVEFDDLQDNVIDLERNPANDSQNIDAWMQELGKRKHDYWAGELSKRGGTLAKYVEAQGEPQCATYNADPKSSDTKALNYVFTAKDKVWIKCVFTKPIVDLARNDGDYWRVEIRWGSEWEDIKMTYDIAKPSTTDTVIFSIPADVITSKIEAKKAATGFIYRGTWLRAQIMYTTRYITGQEWRDGKWVDVWKHDQVAGSSVYLKWH